MKIIIKLFLVITMFMISTPIYARNENTEFEKQICGEWKYIIGGISTDCGVYDSSIIGESGIFTFFEDHTFTLTENYEGNNSFKGSFKEVEPRVIRIDFEDITKYGRECYLEFNDLSNKDYINWRIVKRNANQTSYRNTVLRGLIMTKLDE